MINSYCTHKPFMVVDNHPSISKTELSSSHPTVFGPPTWAYLHISTVHLPTDLNPAIATQVRNTLLAIPVMVPCEACSLHSGNFMAANRARLQAIKTGPEFFNFTVDMHNFVNEKLGKKVVSYDEAQKTWA